MAVERTRTGFAFDFGIPPTGRKLATGLYVACNDLRDQGFGGWRFPGAMAPGAGLFDMGLDENGVAVFADRLSDEEPLILQLTDLTPANTTGLVELAGRPDVMYSLQSRIGSVILRPGYDPERFDGMDVVSPKEMEFPLRVIHGGLYRAMEEFAPSNGMVEYGTV